MSFHRDFAVIRDLYNVTNRRRRIRTLRHILLRVDKLAMATEDELGFDSEEFKLHALLAERQALIWVLDLIDPPIRACPQCGAMDDKNALRLCSAQASKGIKCPMAGPGTWLENLREVNIQHRGEGATMMDAEDWMLHMREQRAARAKQRAARAKRREERREEIAALGYVVVPAEAVREGQTITFENGAAYTVERITDCNTGGLMFDVGGGSMVFKPDELVRVKVAHGA